MAISVAYDTANLARLPVRTPFREFVDGGLKRWLPAPLYWRLRAWRQQQSEVEMRLLPQLCDPGRTSIDIGAAIGTYTVHLLLHSARCWAFEPRPRAARYIAQNLTRPPDPRLRVETVALSDRFGESLLRVVIDDPGRSTMEEAGVGDQRACAELRVPMRRLDDYGGLVGPVGFIKIGVEGHEAAVLRGATGLLARDRPALLIEIEERHKAGSIAAVTRVLGSLGYRGFFFRDGLLHRIESFSVATHQDPGRINEKTGGEPAYVNNFLFLAADSLARLRRMTGAP